MTMHLGSLRKLLRAGTLSIAMLLIALAMPICVFAAPSKPLDHKPAPTPWLSWHSDYGAAYHKALSEGKLFLVHFVADDSHREDGFLKALRDPQVKTLCADFVCLRVPLNHKVTISGETSLLIQHAAFAHMRGKPGLAIVDLKHEDRAFYKQTVSCLPLEKPSYYAPAYTSTKSVRTLLSLPPGTITQRTMIYAVRLHPENPASTRGRAEPYLFSEATGHSTYQARIGVQGHQGFDARFQRIIARVGSYSASEVCAESWPGENLLAACFSCVHSWRNSPSHWQGVSSMQAMYGYDIRRGSNRIWYGTGIFAGK